MLYHLTHIARVDCVEDCEEVLAIGEPILWIFILKELLDLRIVFEHRIKNPHRELIVLWNVDLLRF